MRRQIQPCFVKLCSDEIYTLNYIQVELSNAIHSGSDNSWKIRLWTDYAKKIEFCATDWLDRKGINDWQSASKVQWKQQMDHQTDAFFASCKSAKILKEDIPRNLSIEFLGMIF